MPRMKGADLITESLIRNRIPYVFGICGHGNVGLLDSLFHARDRIKLVSPRHEQVAAHMADAYFRVRHEPVATLTSCGPGSCNIVAVHGAWELPPTPYKEPVFGKRWLPGDPAPAK
jgi:acetolactate synthase-1/2/3 large subunit